MKTCKVCGIEKSLKEYTSYTNYPTKQRRVCKVCISRLSMEKIQKLREELSQLNEENIIKEFNNLKSADRILELLVEGYDVSWSGEDIVIFNKAEKVVHAKNATKEMYNLIFARYCIEVEKRFIKNKKIEESKL